MTPFLRHLKRAMEGDVPFGASGTPRFDLPFPKGDFGQLYAEPFHDEDGSVTGGEADTELEEFNAKKSKVRGGVRIAVVNPAKDKWVWAISNTAGETEDGVAETEEEAEVQYTEAIRRMARRAYPVAKAIVTERMPHLLEPEINTLARKMAVTYPGVFSAPVPKEDRWGFEGVIGQ